MTIVNNPATYDSDVIIRWGTQEVLDDKKGIVYNKSAALATVSHKYRSRKIMAEAGVSVPLDVTLDTPQNVISYPVIARPYKHSKGLNFVILKTRNEFSFFLGSFILSLIVFLPFFLLVILRWVTRSLSVTTAEIEMSLFWALSPPRPRASSSSTWT